MGTDRIPCCVPHCGRTLGRDKTMFDEWICSKHWRHVPKRLRRRLHLAHRRMRAPSRKRPWALLVRFEATAWRACKRAAIEAAMGIG